MLTNIRLIEADEPANVDTGDLLSALADVPHSDLVYLDDSDLVPRARTPIHARIYLDADHSDDDAVPSLTPALRRHTVPRFQNQDRTTRPTGMFVDAASRSPFD